MPTNGIHSDNMATFFDSTMAIYWNRWRCDDGQPMHAIACARHSSAHPDPQAADALRDVTLGLLDAIRGVMRAPGEPASVGPASPKAAWCWASAVQSWCESLRPLTGEAPQWAAASACAVPLWIARARNVYEGWLLRVDQANVSDGVATLVVRV